MPPETQPLASGLSVPPSEIAGVTINHSEQEKQAWSSSDGLMLFPITCFLRSTLAWRSQGKPTSSLPSPVKNDVTGEVGEAVMGRASVCHSLPYIFVASMTMQRK